MMHSDPSTALADYYAQLLPSLQQPPPLQPLTSSALASFPLAQQPGLQHTMSVADPFSPSWPLFSPPSPSARKHSGALFGGGSAGWLDSAQQLLPAVSSAGLSLGGLGVQSQLLPQLSQLNVNLMQRSAVPLQQPLPQQQQHQQQTSVFHPLAQRAGVSGVSGLMQSSPLLSPSPLQQQLGLAASVTSQQLAQLRTSPPMQQTYHSSLQRMQAITGMAPVQQFAPTTQPLQVSPLALLQTLRPAHSNGSSSSQPPTAQQSVTPLQPAAGSTVELATVLLSYLSSAELQHGLLYVNRLWRFKSLYVLQSRQVNIQVQLTHLYLGPFRASNMLELVFSLQVHKRLLSGSGHHARSPVQPLRPLQLPTSLPSSPATATRTQLMPAVTPTVLNSPSTVARATVCTPLALSAVVKAKELSKNETLLGSPSMVLSGGRHLSKKKLREAALLAESKYNSIIECGILPSAEHQPPSSTAAFPSQPSQRVFKLYSPFFAKQVEVYTALSDPAQQTLYRASSLADKFDYATNKVGMYLSRRRLHSGGIYQATGFRSKPAGRTGLKCGGYFLTIEACREFENHFQYGGLTEQQRKDKAGSECGAAVGRSGSVADKEGVDEAEDVDEGEMGDGEESDDEGEEVEHPSAEQVKVEDKPHMAAHGHRPLSAVTKKLLDTSFGHSPSSTASVGGNSRKRSASDDSPELSPDSSDMSPSPSSTFKRLRSDEGGLNTTDSGSGSDGAGNMSSGGLGKRGISSDEDSSDRSPGPSSRTTHCHSHSHSQLMSSTASHSSSASVGSSSSYHRSAFKAPTAVRSSSFQPSSASVASFGSSGSNSNNDSISPPSCVRHISPSSSPGSQQVPTLPASASFLPSVSNSSPPFSNSALPSLSRWHSFASPLMSPGGNQPLFSQQPSGTYVQLSSPPIGVSHQFNGLSLATGASSQSASSSSMAAPVVPLSHSSTAGQSLEAAFASALLQSGQAGALGLAGPSASVGANGLLNLNNLTLQQLQHLLSGHLSTASHASAQPLNLLNQHPSLLNMVLMSAAGQAPSGVQAGQLQQTVQPLQFS